MFFNIWLKFEKKLCYFNISIIKFVNIMMRNFFFKIMEYVDWNVYDIILFVD